jgi:hypothetical protein
MMVWECTSACYVLFWIMIVPASDPKDLFVEHINCYDSRAHGHDRHGPFI